MEYPFLWRIRLLENTAGEKGEGEAQWTHPTQWFDRDAICSSCSVSSCFSLPGIAGGARVLWGYLLDFIFELLLVFVYLIGITYLDLICEEFTLNIFFQTFFYWIFLLERSLA